MYSYETCVLSTLVFIYTSHSRSIRLKLVLGVALPRAPLPCRLLQRGSVIRARREESKRRVISERVESTQVKKKVESTRDESQTRPSFLTIFAVLDAAVRVGEMERAYNDDSQNLVTTLFIHFLYKETRETGDLVYIASIGIFAPG